MIKINSIRISTLITVSILMVLLASASNGQGLLRRIRERNSQVIGGPLTIEKLAELVDDLEEDLFEEGTIGVKSPDVWGQNRMTSYRVEYENEMKGQLQSFEVNLQAALRRSDTAVLASATALGAVLPQPTPRAGLGRRSRAGVRPTQNSVNVNNASSPSADAASEPAAAAGDGDGTEGGTAEDGTTKAATIPRPGDLTKGMFDALTRRVDELQKNALAFPANTVERLSIEPTAALDERSRYINHLHQLRRINTGDDLTDTPGYGLYLIRTPVSLLPGPEVRKGKGAVVTFEASHNLSTDLLQNTFRDVTIIDATYQLSGILLKALHGVAFPSEDDTEVDGSGKVSQFRASGAGGPSTAGLGSTPGTIPLSETVDVYGQRWLNVLTKGITLDRNDWYAHDPSLISWLIGELGVTHRFMREQARNGPLGPLFSPAQFQQVDSFVTRRDYSGLARFRDEFIINLVMTRNACPLPFHAESYHSNGPAPEGGTYCKSVDAYVSEFVRPTDVLVYALLVQSVLVDRLLKEDMSVTAERKGCACADLNALTFYDLFPSEEAKAAFGRYVECKWPIHVFALDPVIEQQNQLDLFSARSELQMALAVAVASGQVNFDQATSYARRLETDLATVGLNRTAIAFGAGESTFGWRFYPRIQTPPTPSNPQRIAGLLLGTGQGPEYLGRNRFIEPGSRECIAMVVVPNFVPAIQLTTFANWFETTGSHADQKLDHGDILEYSRKVQQAKASLGRVSDADRYCPGEVSRLAQLEAQLPSQEYRVALPSEGDLAGSGIFSTSGAKLAPRLLAWYGEPPTPAKTCSVFLLGNAFSVHETKAIAGGVEARVELMSRNVMRLTIPDDARTIQSKDGRTLIDVHVATPNGISNHLFVQTEPAVEEEPEPEPAKSAYTISPATLTLNVLYNVKDPSGAFRPNGGRADVATTPQIVIVWDSPTGTAPKTIRVSLHLHYKVGSITIPFGPSQLILTGANQGTYVIGPDALNDIACEFVEQLASLDDFTLDKPLPILTTERVDITPVSGGLVLDAKTVQANNPLTIAPLPTGAVQVVVPTPEPSPPPASGEMAPPPPTPPLPDPRGPGGVPLPEESIAPQSRLRSPARTQGAVLKKPVRRPSPTVRTRVSTPSARDAAVKPTEGRVLTPERIPGHSSSPSRIRPEPVADASGGPGMVAPAADQDQNPSRRVMSSLLSRLGRSRHRGRAILPSHSYHEASVAPRHPVWDLFKGGRVSTLGRRLAVLSRGPHHRGSDGPDQDDPGTPSIERGRVPADSGH